MAKITRFTGFYKAFGALATGSNRTIFGDLGTQSDTLDDNINADYLLGWETVTPSEFPTKQDFNAMAFALGQSLAYLHQQGIAEYDSLQEYFIGSRTIASNGAEYRSTTNNNIGNDPILGVNWELPVLTGYKNLLINGRKRVNERVYAGGVLADNVYGFDRWKGADSDANIEQIIEQQNITSGIHTISFTGGGTATVDGTSGLSDGDSVSITVAGNISVKVPKAASDIQLEKGSIKTEFELRSIGLERMLCKRYYKIIDNFTAIRSTRIDTSIMEFGFSFNVEMRIAPTVFFGTEITDWYFSLVSGSQINGFVLSVLSSSTDSILIRGSKTTHGFSDSYISFVSNNNYLDAEIY